MPKTADWFENLPEPNASTDCPLPDKLADWVKNPDSNEDKTHLEECPACAAVVEDLQNAKGAEAKLNIFMELVKRSAQEEAAKHASPWRSFFNNIRASRARMVGAFAGAAATLLLGASAVWQQVAPVGPAPQVQSIAMEPDTNGQSLNEALAGLRESYSVVSSRPITKDTTAKQIDTLNAALSKVDKERLQPQQKQELETLQAQYQAVVFRQFDPTLLASAKKPDAQNLKTAFYKRYALRLAQVGEPLTVSPDVSLKMQSKNFYVVDAMDASVSQKLAAVSALQDVKHYDQDPNLAIR